MAKDKRIPRPPTNATRHRRWRVWYDGGQSDAGMCIRETAWRAISPEGDQLEAGDWNDLLAGVDAIEDADGQTRGERLGMIEHNPPRQIKPARRMTEADFLSHFTQGRRQPGDLTMGTAGPMQ